MSNSGMSDAENCYENTDIELWREVEGDYYSPSVHRTLQGGIGINCGGSVFVKPLREWHTLATRLEKALERIPKWVPVTERLPDYGIHVLIQEPTGIYIAKRDGTWWLDTMHTHRVFNPVAWQHLPEPHNPDKEQS